MATPILMSDDSDDRNEKIKKIRAEIVALEKKLECLEEQSREVAAAILKPRPKNDRQGN